ncbi:exo-alpha-sialidase, partial [candidate division WOR-3 bacterium]|nr:exo-alpha-sialidase [candidate division WOR-3 bacterium]
MRYLLLFLIILAFASLLYCDYWTTTDWSDSTTYNSIMNLNGSRQPGNLILDAPDIWNWEYLYSLPGAQNIYDMVISPYGIIFTATGDLDGDVFQSTDLGESWDTTANITGTKWVYGLLSTSDSILYAACVKGNLQSFVAFASNPDSLWNSGNLLPNEKGVYCVTEAENYLFSGTGYLGANIYLSNDGGYNWSLKTGFNDDKVLCMFAISPQLLLAGTGDSKGYILRSSDGGENWSEVDSLNISVEAIIGEIDRMAFLGTSDGRVFSSSDSGLTWSETSILTGANEIKSLFIDDKGIIYAGANAVGNQAGVYFSENNGQSWSTSGNITGRSNIPSILGLENGFLLAGTNVDASIFRAAYFQNGYLISKPYFTGTTNGSTKYGVIQWSDSLGGQTIQVWVRTSRDSFMSTALPWGAGFASVNNGDSIVSNPAVNDSDSYIQYYIKLETDSAGITPFLNEISIEYTIDTLGPEPISAIAYDGIIQQNGIDDDDYVVITFNEPTNEYPIPKDSIDFYLKLNQGSWGEVDTVYWNCEGESGKDTEINLIVELNVNSTIAVGVKITPDTIIKDIWNNSAYGLIQLTGTFDDTIPPNIISAFASDNIDSIQGIDCDDFVRLIFDQITNKPQITAGNINTVLHLSNGHNWGDMDSAVWSTFGETLSVYLDTAGTPTVEPGDTIYPDSVTIEDE